MVPVRLLWPEASRAELLWTIDPPEAARQHIRRLILPPEAVRLEYTDYSPTYCSEACVRDGFTHPSGVRQPGTVEYATELSSYEVLEWTSVEVVTVQMGQPVSAIAGCDIFQQVLPATSLALSLMATQHPSVSTTSSTQHIEFWLPWVSARPCKPCSSARRRRREVGRFMHVTPVG